MNWLTPIYLLIAQLLVLLNGFFVLAVFALARPLMVLGRSVEGIYFSVERPSGLITAEKVLV